MKTMAKLSSPSIIAKGIALRATGATAREMGKELNVSHRAALDFTDKYKDAINELALQLIDESIQPIKYNHLQSLALARKLYQITAGELPIKEASNLMATLAMLNLLPKDVIDQAYKRELKIMQMIGIAPSHAPSTVINMLFAGDKAGEDVQELESVQAFLSWKRSEDVQDAEVIDTSEPEGEST